MERARLDRMSFLTAEEVAEIAGDPETRLELLLVRCGGGRFLAPAQDVAHFIGIIEREATYRAGEGGEGSDYIRDVSIPAGWSPVGAAARGGR